ncbi:hypothetical protein J5N97_025904 [Dioscorea zingiberensis]|uniref:Uncharacterized protein n=1 Tax=Dioscorea zingiberensis TaxID=325984 RepID=A0A9D5C1F0_9LILI|nr:hypothetical protein J5N97_025904 [Dioscorea zingiberensis]
MASAPKRRKIEEEKGYASESVVKAAPFIPLGHSDGIDFKVRQDKKFAVAQAQQEGCLGNYRSFDSPFGNYLVPVIPTRSELYRNKSGDQ